MCVPVCVWTREIETKIHSYMNSVYTLPPTSDRVESVQIENNISLESKENVWPNHFHLKIDVVDMKRIQ